MLTLFDALAVFAPYWARKWELGLGWTGPEVPEETTSVPIPLIGKATKWRQRYSGFYGSSMWMPLKMQEWCALWWLRPTRATVEALGIFLFLDNDATIGCLVRELSQHIAGAATKGAVIKCVGKKGEWWRVYVYLVPRAFLRRGEKGRPSSPRRRKALGTRLGLRGGAF